MPVVTSVGISINTQHGPEAASRLDRAVNEALLWATQNGLSAETHGPIIQRLMMAAHDREQVTIELEIQREELAAANEKLQRVRDALIGVR